MERRGFLGKVLGGIAAGFVAKKVVAEEPKYPATEALLKETMKEGPPWTTLGTNIVMADGREMRYVRRSLKDHLTLYAGNVVYWATDAPYIVTAIRQRANLTAYDLVAGVTVANCLPGDYIWIQVAGPTHLQTAPVQTIYKNDAACQGYYRDKDGIHYVTLTAEEMRAEKVDVIIPEGNRSHFGYDFPQRPQRITYKGVPIDWDNYTPLRASNRFREFVDTYFDKK